MAFPTISIKTTNYTVTPGLESVVHQKFDALGKFIGEKETAHAEVIFEKIGDHHSGKIFKMDMNLTVGGKVFYTTATEDQMEHAVDEVRDEIKRKLIHDRTREQSIMKRGGQRIKQMLRLR